MNNTPYENESLFPRVVGLSLVTGAGVGIYKYQKSETFRDSVHNLGKKLTTVKEEERSYTQNLTENAYKAMTSVGKLRGERDAALRKSRAESEAAKFKDATFDSINGYVTGGKPSGGIHFTHIDQVADIEGKSIGTDIINKLSEKLGVNPKSVEHEFSGTTLKFKYPKGTGFETINVPLWKRLEGNVWAMQNGEAGATYVARMSVMAANKKQGLLLDPMTSMLDALSNPESTGYFYELGGGAKDASTRARDQLGRKLDKVAETEIQRRVMEGYELKRVLKGHRDSIAQYVTGHEIQEQAGVISKTYVPYEPSLHRIGHVGVIGKNTARVDGRGQVVAEDNVMAHFNFIQDIKAGNVDLGIGMYDPAKGRVVKAKGTRNGELINEFTNNFNFNLSQSQTAYGAGSTITGLSDASAPESLKAVKSLYFRDNPQSVGFSYIDSKHRVNPAVRNKTQHLLPEMGVANPMLEKFKARGAINLPAIIDPYSTEAVMVGPKILNQRITKQVEFKLNEVAQDSPLHGFLQNLLNTPDDKIMDELFIEKGNLLGRTKATGNVRNIEELSQLGQWNYEKAPWDLRITREHALAIKNRNLGKSAEDPFVLFAQYEDKFIKAGTADGTIRGSVVDASKNSNMAEYFGSASKVVARERGMAVLPEAAISSDLYKNIWQRGLGGEGMIMGKGRGEYLSSLRSMILGHVSQPTTDFVASGEMLNLMNKYTDIGVTENSANISGIYRNRGISFLNNNEATAQEVIDLQKMFAATRKAVITGGEKFELDSITQNETEDILGRTFKLYGEVLPKYTKDQIVGREDHELPQQIKDMLAAGEIQSGDLKDLYTSFAMAPHEAEAYTLGRGEGIMRISGINLSNSMDMPYAIREAAMKSMTSAPRQMTETKMMFASLNGSLTKEMMEEYSKQVGETVPVLSSGEEVMKMMGPGEWLARSSEAIKDPTIFFNSFLGEEQNPNGFFVKTKTAQGAEGFFFHPSAKWNGGMTAIADGSFRPAREESYILARAMREAATNDGMIQGKALEQLSEDLGKARSSLLEAAEIKAEGSEYAKLVNNQFLVDTHKKIGQELGIESLGAEAKSSLKDVDFMMGSMTTYSMDSAKTMIKREIDDAVTLVGGDKTKAISKLEEMYGEGNMISDALRKAGPDWNSREVAGTMAEESANAWDKIKSEIPGIIEEAKLGNQAAVTELKKHLDKTGFNTWLTRYPDLYSKSSLKTYGYVDREASELRQLSAGHVVQSVFSGDTDGDAVRKMLQWSQLSRQETARHFELENRTAYEWMQNLKGQDVLKAVSNKRDTGFMAVPEKYASEYADALKMLQEEQVAASVLTKGFTGTATMKAWGQQAYFEQVLKNNKAISEETASRARAAINTMIPLSGPQSIISSKHARAILTGQRLENGELEQLASMKAIMSNIGDIDEATLNDSIKQLGDVHVMHELAVEAIQKPSNSNHALKANPIVEDIKNFDDLKWSWNRKSEEQLRRLHGRGWIGEEGEDFERVMERYNTATANTKFFSEDEALVEAFQTNKISHRIDFLSEAAQKGGSASNSYTGARAKVESAIRNLSSKNIVDNQEIISKTLYAQETQHLKEAFGHDAFVPNWARVFSKAEQVRTYPIIDKAVELAGKYVTGKNVAMAAGAALLGFTAMNLISGDGTPHELNDLPSYNNPSFHNNSYNDMNERRSLNSSYNTNMSSSLLTDTGTSRDTLMGHLNNIVGLRGYNSSTVIHDGSDPYKSDMYQYRH